MKESLLLLFKSLAPEGPLHWRVEITIQSVEMRRIEGLEKRRVSPSKTRVVRTQERVRERRRRREVGRPAVRVGSGVREVVADPTRSQRLIESGRRRYPLGSVLAV